jgi:hypothetical protein
MLPHMILTLPTKLGSSDSLNRSYCSNGSYAKHYRRILGVLMVLRHLRCKYGIAAPVTHSMVRTVEFLDVGL